MRYKFITAYCVLGMAMKPEQGDVTFFREQGIHAYLTQGVNEALALIDRQTALGRLCLGIFAGQSTELDPKAARERQVAEIIEARSRKYPPSAFLIVEIEGDVNAIIPSRCEHVEDFLFCFDAYDKKALSASVQSNVVSALSAVRMAGETDFRFELVSQGSYLIDDAGVVIHSVSITGGAAELIVGRMLNIDQVAAMSEFIVPLRQSPELAQAIDLHAQSLNRHETKLRAFMAAWNALELFVKETKTKYSPIWSTERYNPTTSIESIATLESIPHKNSKLARQFGKMACYLGGDSQLWDIVEFVKLLKVRNDLSHELKDNDLPVHRVQKLFDKYMKGHLRYT